MARRTPDREYIPPVQTLQVRYAKRGRMRFASHRDFQRAWERALRRVGVPMAYSAGFSPHPKVSYAGAAPTGAASEAEFLEFSVVQQVDPRAVRQALDAALPEGLDIVAVVEATAPLVDQLRASRWRMEWPFDVTEAIAAFAAADSVEVERITKDLIGALKTVYDPEIPVDIYELGLIYKVDLDDNRNLAIDMTLTAPGCPVAGEMPGWVENAVGAVEGVSAVDVEMTFDPPWSADRMSEEAQVALGWY